MAKKTKKEKIISDLRRKLSHTNNQSDNTTLELKKPLKEEIKEKSGDLKYNQTLNTDNHLLLLKKDIFKTFIVGFLIFLFELILYFAMEKKIFI